MPKTKRNGKVTHIAHNVTARIQSLEQVNQKVDDSKWNKTAQALPRMHIDNINRNLKLSDEEYNQLANKEISSVTWSTKMGKGTKMHVTMKFENGKLKYDAKQGNKIITKGADKATVANKVAQYYADRLGIKPKREYKKDKQETKISTTKSKSKKIKVEQLSLF